MSTNARILLAGVLTSVIVAVGFGSSLLAQSRIKQPSGYQSPANSQQLTPVRVILPASAEPAQPPQPSTVVASETAPQTQAVQPPTPAVKQVERAEALKPTADERRERRRRYVERRSKMIAARAQMERRGEPGILAFGGDEPRRSGFPGN
jgi:type IV secretory pathway VirB10-like protein